MSTPDLDELLYKLGVALVDGDIYSDRSHNGPLWNAAWNLHIALNGTEAAHRYRIRVSVPEPPTFVPTKRKPLD